MLRLDELTIALHKHYSSSSSETSSDSTARPAHRHKAVAASTSPAHRHIGDSTVTAQQQWQKFPVHSAYELRGRRLMPTSISTAHRRTGDSTLTAPREPPAHRHIRRQHSDSSSSIGEFPVHPADELRGGRLPRVGSSLYHGN